MNPIILRTRESLNQALSINQEYSSGKWGPAIPLHSFFHRLQAAWLVLKGKSYVLETPEHDL